jgi:class 3 adenylate cyclase
LNPTDFQFCGKCGAALSRNTAYLPGEFARLYNYTPKFLADKILSHRGAIEGERKIITVLFADLANSTSISEQLDQETMHNLMDGCIKIILSAVHHYEGIVNQFMGDGVMALFGAPVAHKVLWKRSGPKFSGTPGWNFRCGSESIRGRWCWAPSATISGWTTPP